MDNKRVDEIIDKYQAQDSALIQVLLDIQSENHWLPKEALERVSERLAVPLSKVQHAVTFYKAFSLAPEGRHRVHVCNGSSCHTRGAQRVIDTLEDTLGILPGETSPDLKFSLETVTCLGRCGCGPAVEIDGEYHDNLEPAQADEILKNCD